LAGALVAVGCAGGSTPTSADSGDGKPDATNVDALDVVAVDVVADRGQDVPVDHGAPVDLGFDAGLPDAGFDSGPQGLRDPLRGLRPRRSPVPSSLPRPFRRD